MRQSTATLRRRQRRRLAALWALGTAGAVLAALADNGLPGGTAAGLTLLVGALSLEGWTRRGSVVRFDAWAMQAPLTRRSVAVLAGAVWAMLRFAMLQCALAIAYVAFRAWFDRHVPLLDSADDFVVWMLYLLMLGASALQWVDAGTPDQAPPP